MTGEPEGRYRRKWDAEPKPEHPAPEVVCRLAQDSEIPSAARRMSVVATTAGWSVVATYARGTTLSRVPKVVDSLALRMSGHDRRAVAVWLDGKFNFGIRWGAGVALQTIGARNLTLWLSS